MKNNYIMRISPLMTVLLFMTTGCASMYESQRKQAANQMAIYAFEADYSTGDSVGKLNLKLRELYSQPIVSEYTILINGLDPVAFPKQSDIHVLMDTGEYQLTFFANAPNGLKWLYGEQFGKPTHCQFAVDRNETTNLELIGPSSAFQAGSCKEVW